MRTFVGEYTNQHSSLNQIVSAQILLTQDDFVDKRRYKNAMGPCLYYFIVNFNSYRALRMIVSSCELKVGDNDTLSAQVAMD